MIPSLPLISKDHPFFVNTQRHRLSSKRRKAITVKYTEATVGLGEHYLGIDVYTYCRSMYNPHSIEIADDQSTSPGLSLRQRQLKGAEILCGLISMGDIDACTSLEEAFHEFELHQDPIFRSMFWRALVAGSRYEVMCIF